MTPTFNTFSLQDDNFITERIQFKDFANRDFNKGQISRREGIKLLGTEFTDKKIEVSGRIIADSASDLQSKIDSMKRSLTGVEAELSLESGRTFLATVTELRIPDEHYNVSTSLFSVVFTCSNPFATSVSQTAVQNVVSGLQTLSGMINISGTYFNRPLLTYTPGSPTSGRTNIRTMTLTHTPTGQFITVTGFGGSLGLQYQNPVIFDFDNLIVREGSSIIDNLGAFAKWEPGDNNYTLTVSGNFPGGSVSVAYQPRYI